MRCVHDRHAGLKQVALAAAVAWMILATTGHGMTVADHVGSLGETDRLVVRGTQQIDPEQLRQPLLHDTDLVWLSRPHAARDAYVAAVVRKATLALERAGFATATVHAAVESSDGVERLVVDVVEGPRFETGSINVTGLPGETRARLVRFLSEPQPPRDAVPRNVDQSDGTTTTIWVTTDGLPAPLESPVWKQAGPAPCDAVTLHQIHVAVVRFLRDEGYLSIPLPLPDRRSAGRATHRSTPGDGAGAHRAAVEVAIKPGERTVELAVAINDLPPKSVLRRIEVPPECRTTERDLIASLGIQINAPVTDRDRLIWRDSLRRSGRFVKSEIEFRGDPTDPEAVVARFSLDEYAAATPLSQPLSREEATMLRVHDWLMAAIGRGDDLVLDVTQPPAGPGVALPASASARLIVAPTRGFLLTALPDSDQACGLAVSGTGMSLLPADGAGRLDIPLPSHYRFTATLGLSLVQDKSAGTKPPKYNRRVSFSCGMSDGRNGAPAAVTIAVPVEPAICLSVVHENSPRVRFEGDTLVVEADGATSRFDATTGRPLGLTIAGCCVSLDARPGVLDAAVEHLRVASGPNMVRSEAPVGSAVEFLLSGEVAAACRRIADAAGLHGAARSLWEQRLAWGVDVVRRCRADGGLERCDRMLATASTGDDAHGDTVAALEPLVIPREDEPTSAAATQKALMRQIAAVVWRLTDEHCGRTSWPAALVRAGSCALVGDPAMLDEMAEFMSADDHGPLAYASASSLVTVPLVAASLARRGQERLSTIAFHTDCHPLLAAVATYGLDDCCVSLLRSVDDDTVREIGRTACGNPDLLLPLVHSLKAHERHEDAVAGLQDSLDVWWDGSLRPVVAAKLDAIASPRTANAGGPRDEQPLKK
jgi:hypothetical protein